MKSVQGVKPGWSATFSDDERYRYSLERRIAPVGLGDRRLVSCGLNPSTADELENDRTVGKESKFAAMWDCSLYVKVNAYAWRTKSPADMFRCARAGKIIIGELEFIGGVLINYNDAAIRCALQMMKADPLGGIALAAWGRHVRPERVKRLVQIAREVGVEWMCLRTNQDGSPEHPLYVPYATPLVPWPVAA